MKSQQCPFCESTVLKSVETNQTINHRDGRDYLIEGYQYTVCVTCENEFVDSNQARNNERILTDAWRKTQNLLSTDEIRRIRKRLALRQEDASQIFGGGANAFSKYERGYVTQSVAMDRLIRVADRYPEALKFLREFAGVQVSVRKKKEPSTFVSSWESVLHETVYATVLVSSNDEIYAVAEKFGKDFVVQKSKRPARIMSTPVLVESEEWIPSKDGTNG